MKVEFFRESWDSEFVTVPSVPADKIREITEKYAKEIKENSAVWGEVQFVYDGKTVHFWTAEENSTPTSTSDAR